MWYLTCVVPALGRGRRSWNLRLFLATQRVQSKPGLQETLSKKPCQNKPRFYKTQEVEREPPAPCYAKARHPEAKPPAANTKVPRTTPTLSRVWGTSTHRSSLETGLPVHDGFRSSSPATCQPRLWSLARPLAPLNSALLRPPLTPRSAPRSLPFFRLPLHGRASQSPAR